MSIFRTKAPVQIAPASTIEIKDNTYYYPKNLRAKTKVFVWSFGAIWAVMAVSILSLMLWYSTKIPHFVLAAVLIAFLTVSIDDTTIASKIYQMLIYAFTAQDYKNALKPNTTQKLCGGKYISQNGIYTTEFGRFAMWEVAPFNLSIMSPGAIETHIRSMTSLLAQCPGLEIMAMDAAVSFDENIAYLKQRISEEENPEIRKLLEEDLTLVLSITTAGNNSRRYLFIYKIPGSKENDISVVRRYSKAMQDSGFNIVQMERSQVKQVIANYLDIVSVIPDYDGLQYVEDGE